MAAPAFEVQRRSALARRQLLREADEYINWVNCATVFSVAVLCGLIYWLVWRSAHLQHVQTDSTLSNSSSSQANIPPHGAPAPASPRHLPRRLTLSLPGVVGIAPAPAPAPEDAYLAMCAVVKDQSEDVREWLDWQLALGVGRIYFFDNNSSAPMLSQMSDLVASGRVVYTFFVRHPRKVYTKAQLYVYSKCIRDHGSKHRWMAFIDADEFFVIKDGTPSLPALLREYEGFGGLAVNWQLFGSSGHVKRPQNGTLHSYTACLPADADESRHVKTIANTRYVERPLGPHHFSYKAGRSAVNTDSLPVRGPRSNHTVYSRLVLNHYVTKSLEEFHAKERRGSAMSNHKTIHFFRYIDEQATEVCPPPAPLGGSRRV